MNRPLLVTDDLAFLDEVVDCLGPDVDIEVTTEPTEQQWKGAPLVLIDACAQTLVGRMPAHPWPVVIAAGARSRKQAGAHCIRWRDDPNGGAVYLWPEGVDAVRRMVADALALAPRPYLCVGVVGGHGGAGASTLAVVLAQAACHAGRRTALIDGDPLGGGIAARLGDGRERYPVLRVVDQDQVADFDGGLERIMRRTRSDVKIVDLGRAVDDNQLTAAAGCDVVLLVTDAARNVAATRRVLEAMVRLGVAVAVVGRSDTDHTADHIAADYTAPRAGDMPPDNRAVSGTGSVTLLPTGALFAFAVDLLAELPALAAEAAR